MKKNPFSERLVQTLKKVSLIFRIEMKNIRKEFKVKNIENQKRFPENVLGTIFL
jgi:hypothetical protein